jgi:hypothetical protein
LNIIGNIIELVFLSDGRKRGQSNTLWLSMELLRVS